MPKFTKIEEGQYLALTSELKERFFVLVFSLFYRILITNAAIIYKIEEGQSLALTEKF